MFLYTFHIGPLRYILKTGRNLKVIIRIDANVRASWCDSTGSKLKKDDKILMQNWNLTN